MADMNAGLSSVSSPIPAAPLSAIGGPKKKQSILDGIITGLSGQPTSEMTQAEGARVEKERAAGHVQAGALANSAMMNPGKSFMEPPPISGKGGSFGDMIRGIMEAFKKPDPNSPR